MYVKVFIVNVNKFSFLKECLPSLKQHLHLVCWEHLHLAFFYTGQKPSHRRTSTIVIESVGKLLFWQKKAAPSAIH